MSENYLDAKTPTEEFTDDEFDAFVKKNKQEEESRNTSGRFQFADILYTSIPQQTQSDPDAMAIVRFRGGPPNSNRTPYTARSIISSLIRDDANKLFKLKLPVSDRSHLFWRIINTVTETVGKGATAVPVWKDKAPEIYNRVRYGEAKPTSNSFKYSKGWKGREWLIANVIDRKLMDIHREEKHCMLLCKDARPSRTNPDVVFYDDGVPAYGFISALTVSLFQPYKNWENYDVGIFRLGKKEMPYRLINASRYLPEIPDNLKPLVGAEGPISDEEKSWGMYDLEKLAKVTTYNTFLTKVGGLVMEMDTHMGTTFYDELTALAAKEAAEDQERKAESEAVPETETSKTISEEPMTAATPSPVIPSRSKTDPVESTPNLPFHDKMRAEGFSEEDIKLVIGYDESATNIVDRIKYSIPMEMLVACNHPGCGGPSPESFSKCPHCFKSFT